MTAITAPSFLCEAAADPESAQLIATGIVFWLERGRKLVHQLYAPTRGGGSSSDVAEIVVACCRCTFIAKQCPQRCSAEEYAIKLAKHFVITYPKVCSVTVVGAAGQPSQRRPGQLICCLFCCAHRQVTQAKIWVEQKPWRRVTPASWGAPPARLFHDPAPRFARRT